MAQLSRAKFGGLLLFTVGCARSPVGALETDTFEAGASATDAGGVDARASEQDTADEDGAAALSARDASEGSDEKMPDTPAPSYRAGFFAARRVYQQMQSISGSLAGAPINGRLLNTHTIYSLVTIGEDSSFVETACGAEIKSRDADGSSKLFESGVSINPTVFDHLEPLRHRIEWTQNGWSIPPTFTAVGWMAQASSEPIPTVASDPRVFDQDQDGHPGITVKLSGNVFATGDLYAVQSVRYRAEGVFAGDDLSGQDFDMGEQEVIGSRNIVDTQQMVSAAGNSSTNRMDLVKRPAGTLTCKQLLADPSIFPAHPVFP